MANSTDPDQTAPSVGLHCLLRCVCRNIKDHYNIFQIVFFNRTFSHPRMDYKDIFCLIADLCSETV